MKGALYHRQPLLSLKGGLDFEIYAFADGRDFIEQDCLRIRQARYTIFTAEDLTKVFMDRRIVVDHQDSVI
jgi:hypothetical protein